MCGVIDLYGNVILPDRYLYPLKGNNLIAYEHRGTPTIYYNKDLEVVCYDSDYGTFDKNGKIIWKDFQLNTLITDMANFENNIYVIQKTEPGSIIRGLASINKIPKPAGDVAGSYIALMLNNPLMNINGETKLLEEDNYFVVPLLEDGRTLVPFRVIFEALGASVGWDGSSTKTVTAAKGDITVELRIDEREMYVNGNKVLLDVPARLVGSRTFVPLRAVSESLGAAVHWDEKTETITITN